ncbi:MAG TPA: iron-containing redox enzyme family protein, partial [Mycobacteriales bacterium]|nr:iron-containing redox enzyme family protein [Mycobacteriales bacterium]
MTTQLTAPLPAPRGPVSATLLAALVRPPHPMAPLPPVAVTDADPLTDEDLLLSLHVCYELHYRGLTGVSDDWEWEPSLLAFRAGLESRLEAGLRALVAPEPVEPAEVPRALAAVVDADDGPSVASYVQRRASLGQVREMLVHRSIYQLKEADPHTWAIPRLAGRAKAALVEIQTDEYGNGRPERMHSALFATSMRELGLDDTYGAHVDLVPAVTLATSVVATYFGLHRRWRGAIAG